MIAVEVSECTLIKNRGINTRSQIKTLHSLWLTHPWWHVGCAMWGSSRTLSGQPFKVNPYTVLWIGSLSTASLTMFNLSGVKWMLCMFWCNLIGMFSLCEGQPSKTISFPDLYLIM